MSTVVTVRLPDKDYSKLEFIAAAMQFKMSQASPFIIEKITPGKVAQAMIIASCEKLYPEYREDFEKGFVVPPRVKE